MVPNALRLHMSRRAARSAPRGPGGGPVEMVLSQLKIVGMVSAAFWLVACSIDPAQNPAWELAGHPGLLYDIQLYYQRNALEENGRCTRPLLQGVTRSEVLAEDDEQLVIALTYRYRDSI